jgi:hypothetical protein
MTPRRVAEVGAVEPVEPTDGLVAEIEPVIGRGFEALTNCVFPLPSSQPIIVAEPGTAVPTGFTEALLPLPPPVVSRFPFASNWKATNCPSAKTGELEL